MKTSQQYRQQILKHVVLCGVWCAVMVACMMIPYRVSAQFYARDYQDFKELYAHEVGQTACPGFGGIVVPISDDIVSVGATLRNEGNAIAYNVYKRSIGSDNAIGEWFRLNAQPVQMANQARFESVIGTTGLIQAFSLARGQRYTEGSTSTKPSAKSAEETWSSENISQLARASQSPSEYIARVAQIGSVNDVLPFFLNSYSLVLFGMVYVDSSNAMHYDDARYEYAIAPINARGHEGEKILRGIVFGKGSMTRLRASDRAVARETLHRIEPQLMNKKVFMSWSFMPFTTLYSFSVYRKKNSGKTEHIETFLANNDSTVFLDGVRKPIYSMRWIDTEAHNDGDELQYTVAATDYLNNEYAVLTSRMVSVLDRDSLPIIPAPAVSYNDSGVRVSLSYIPAKRYFKEVRVLRTDHPDKEYQVVQTIPLDFRSVVPIVKTDTLQRTASKVTTIRSTTIQAYPEQIIADDVVPGTMYFYRTQVLLNDGTVGKLSPYTTVIPEYTVKPEPIKATAITVLPLDSAYTSFRSSQQGKGRASALLQSISDVVATTKCGTYMMWNPPVGGKYPPRAYYVHRSDNGGRTWRQVSMRIRTSAPESLPEFIDTTQGLNQYRPVQYRIIAENISGYESDPSESVETFPSYNEPIQPPGSHITAERLGAREIMLHIHEYKNYGHIEKYGFYRKNITNSAESAEWIAITPTSAGSGQYLDATASPDSSYQYTYTLRDIRGYESNRSIASDVAPQPSAIIKERQIAPQNLRIRYTADGVILVWDPITEPTIQGYTIVRAGRDKVFERVGYTSRSGIVFEQAIDRRTIYYYKVIPVFTDKQGIPSEEISAIRY